MIEINAFDGLDGETVIDFARDGVGVNFENEGVNAIRFDAGGKSVQCDFSGNSVTFKPGKLGLKPGIYYGKVVAVTDDKPSGEAIAGPGLDIEIELRYHA